MEFAKLPLSCNNPFIEYDNVSQAVLINEIQTIWNFAISLIEKNGYF